MIPKLPLAHWINQFVNWLYNATGPFFEAIANVVKAIIEGIDQFVQWLPWWLVIVLFGVLAFRSGRWKLSIGTVVGLLFIYDLQLWRHMISTLVLVIVSSLLSLLIGLPLGIMTSKSERLHRIVTPLLDLMQTMPSFVYLVPVLMFFNIGVVPAIFATMVFAMPPSIRLTRLGILQVPKELVEASRSFGSTDWQLLRKVQLPLAMPTIKAGINQTIMLALSMVVIASMIGAGGLGADVMSALETVDVGKGFEAGISIVIIAIVLDRISQRLGNKRLSAKPKNKQAKRYENKKENPIIDNGYSYVK
ncbi:proline/glycine betaine ABC transporter permease [Fodinisporobacter ferrooxydans]|uniref:Proline/glycine betaine ABC transporter permease n=1 Tax=Fodinisporobacter ferrooxydans TaxID=2901836 RepID=A0ABY4CR13_9BACL|nr:proline/glycine betaine ABC transporter permease [Alicyclobacillaceae bacterium MYW30-H2]